VRKEDLGGMARGTERGEIASRRNATLVACVLAFLLLVLLVRFGTHQLVPSRGLVQAAVVRHQRPGWRYEHTLLERPSRGRILDRRGRLLAASWYEHVLVVDPTEFSSRSSGATRVDVGEVLPELLEAAGARLLPRYAEDHELLRRALTEATRPDGEGGTVRVRHRVLTRGMPPPVYRHLLEMLRTAGLRGFSFDRRLRRSYPGGAPCSQVVGLVGATASDGDILGRTGIEKAFDSVLTGRPGLLSAERDAAGREIVLDDPWVREPAQGTELVLTLDEEIQGMVYDVLAAHEAEHDTLATTAIVLSVADGEILAMCSYPAVDPAALEEGRMEDLCLPAVQHLYTPGSTIKPVFLAWALETGVVDTRETFDCGGHLGCRRFGRRVVREFGLNPEPLDLAGIIMRSSNVGAVRVCMERLGLDGMYAALEAFGIDRPPAFPFPDVPVPRINPRNKARLGYTGPAFPQGYEMVVSPLGMARAYLTLARGGEEIEPRLVRAYGTPEGFFRTRPETRPVIHESVADFILGAMKQVVENRRGTGHKARSTRWTIAAKTGTGQVDRLPGRGLYNAWFCSAAPADDPAVVVVVHTQVKRHRGRPYTGGSVSGKPAREIIERVLDYLRVPPDRPEEEEE